MTKRRLTPRSSSADSWQTSAIFVPYPTCSPDFVPADFFPKHKTALKGRRFQTIEEIQENEIRELRAMCVPGSTQTMDKSLERCITSRGDLFEGNSA
jgi:hypothetical protein